VVRGVTVDLEAVYRRIQAEAHPAADGRLIHTRGLKYLLAEMHALHADAGVPAQPLFDLRRETAQALRALGWVAPVSRNSGRYELLRERPRSQSAIRTAPTIAPPAGAERAVPPRRPSTREGPRRDGISSFFASLSENHGMRMEHGARSGDIRWIGLYSPEQPAVYRYAFTEWWRAVTPEALVAWVLLNPGVGDTMGTPRTILGRCRSLTNSWGFRRASAAAVSALGPDQQR
jgi:hypothetical protein